MTLRGPRLRPLAVLVLLAAAGCARPDAREPTASVRRGAFEEQVVVSGRLRAAETVVVQAGTRGKLSFLVPEGTVVAAGDPLFALETDEMEQRLESAQLDLGVAEAELAKAEEDRRLAHVKDALSLREKEAALEFARLRQQEAEDDLARKRRQVEAQIAPRAELSRAELAVQQAQLSLDNADIDLARLREEISSRRETSELDRASAQARVDKQRSQLAEVREFMDQATARAPRAGIVAHASSWRGSAFQVGEEVWRNAPIVELPDLSRIEVEAQVNEVDAARVESGLPARVSLGAFPDLALTGRVSEVGGLARELQDREGRNTGVRAFDLAIALDAQDARLRPGMSATVDIVVGRHEDVLLVPAAAVRGSGEDAHVLTASGRTVSVRVVASGPDEVALEGDLSAGDEVVLALAAPSEPGAAEETRAAGEPAASAPPSGPPPAAAPGGSPGPRGPRGGRPRPSPRGVGG